jgi:hypothetical protein
MNNPYQKIQDKVLQILINKKNTIIVSQKLGYKFNQVNRWLNHSKVLKWDEFIELCKVVKFPIETTLEDTFGISIRNTEECKKAFIKILLSEPRENKSLGKVLHKSRPSLYRLRKSKTTPAFTDVLALIDIKPKRLAAFVGQFSIGLNSVVQRSPFTVPWFGVVSSAMAQKEHLSLPEYSMEWIARRVNLSISQVKLAIEVMKENDLIELNGKHYQPTRSRTIAINHVRNQSDFLNTLKFWLQKSLAALEFHKKTNSADDRFQAVFRTFMTSPETVKKINELIAETEEKIHNLISSSEGEKSEIRCLVVSHFDVADTERV